jgi:hypothetical protein
LPFDPSYTFSQKRSLEDDSATRAHSFLNLPGSFPSGTEFGSEDRYCLRAVTRQGKRLTKKPIARSALLGRRLRFRRPAPSEVSLLRSKRSRKTGKAGVAWWILLSGFAPKGNCFSEVTSGKPLLALTWDLILRSRGIKGKCGLRRFGIALVSLLLGEKPMERCPLRWVARTDALEDEKASTSCIFS